MYSVERLDILGYRNKPVPNTFLKQDEEKGEVAILLPGLEYTCQMPLLYYPARLLLYLGADVLEVEYAYNLNPDFQALSGSEQLEWLFSDAAAAYKAALAKRSYQKVVLVGKSIGTLAMGQILTTQSKPQEVQAIWLTPLLRNENLRRQILECKMPSLFIIGTADPHHHPDYLDEIKKAGEVIVIQNGDHSLEIKGDINGSLKAMEEVINAIKSFLSR